MIRFLSALGLVCLSLALLPERRLQAQSDQATRFTSFEKLGQTQSAQSKQDDEVSAALSPGFVITGSDNETSCRRLTGREALQMRVSERRTEMRVISEERFLKSQAQTFKIVLRSTPQLDSFPQAKEAFLRAAAVWESVIQSPITIILDVDYGPTRFGTPYPDPNIIGATATQLLFGSTIYPAIRSRLIAGAANAQQTAIFNALPATSFPTDSGSSVGSFGESPELRALGLIAATADPSTEPGLGPPPSIGFNSAFSFDFDPSNGIDFDKIDFNATAVHEIGHALGFTSMVGFRELIPTIPVAPNLWDLYRFRPGVNLTSFGASPRVLLSDGEHIHFAGGAELALSTGDPNGDGGDEQQASHWKDDAQSGRFIGIMDPTATRGQIESLTASDLLTLGHLGYRVKDDAPVLEILSIDDSGRNATPVSAGALVVNRLAPSRYPATVKGVKVVVPFVTEQPSPVGASLRIVVFNDPTRVGQPPANPTFLFDQTFTVPAITSSRFVEFSFNGPTINSGDLYIGVQATNTPIGIAIDTNGPRPQGSFISLNSGGSFQSLTTLVSGAAKANFMARALVTSPFNSAPTPSLASVSPNAVAPGGPAFTLSVQGDGFQSNSVVRWNGIDRPTTLVSGSLLTAAIPAGDVTAAGTASVTVFNPTPGGGASTSLPVTIGTDNPAPTLARVDPIAGALGGSTLTINAFGTNFTPNSALRFNGANRTTTLVSSVQLSATLQASDLVAAGNGNISVFNPTPGGGGSNELPFTVVTCAYSLSSSSQNYSTAGGTNGVLLTTISPCNWTASADVPWITVTNPTGAAGTGKYVIGFRVAANTTAGVRTGALTIGGRTLNIRQAGVISSVSAANYAGPLAAEAITAAFGLGLANSTLTASGVPLPTTLGGVQVRVTDALSAVRTAPLFFVSPNQVNYQTPTGAANGTASVAVILDGVTVANGTVSIVATSPGLFSANASGQGVAAANLLRVKANGDQVYEPVSVFDQGQNRFVPKPIDFGADSDQLFLIVFGTGIRGRSALSAVTVKIGDVDITPQFAGPQGNFIGLDQLNLPLPRSLKGRGEVTINVTVDGRAANAVTVTIE